METKRYSDNPAGFFFMNVCGEGGGRHFKVCTADGLMATSISYTGVCVCVCDIEPQQLIVTLQFKCLLSGVEDGYINVRAASSCETNVLGMADNRR